MLQIYGGDPEQTYRDRIAPFLREQRPLLASIYREHEVLPTARCLDDYEGLMVLQQLLEDPDRLRDLWSLEPEELYAVAVAGGVRLAAF